MKMYTIGDFHIHTNYCPHGTMDSMEEYINVAIARGLKEVSFTEHAPLPKNFQDPAPERDSAMSWSDLSNYFVEGEKWKQKYRDQIKVHIGFEVDYIEGFETDTRYFLNQYGELIDDAILSVHMLKLPDGSYVCLDYSADEFKRIISLFGDVDTVYQAYYQTILKAVDADLGAFKPKRIGHLTLVEKFSRKYPARNDFANQLEPILQKIKENQLALDLNTAGLFKEDCQTLYPNPSVINRAKELGINLVPGSDSHEAKTIARGYDQILGYFS